jgi:hypothetical protein
MPESWDRLLGHATAPPQGLSPNSQVRFLAGYQREAWKDFTVGFQGYAEVMRDYTAYRRSLPAGAPAQEHIRGVLTTRLTQYLHYQTWRLSLFAAYSPTDEDYFLQPAISYKVTEIVCIAESVLKQGSEQNLNPDA